MPEPAEIKIACEAMATRFEILLYGDDPVFLRAAGEEALGEIARIERKLSYFRADSTISRINRNAASQPVRVDPELFALLENCTRFWRETHGGFDITLSPLFEAWGMRAKAGRQPDETELKALRAQIGMERLILDPSARTVAFEAPGMKLDLGGVGKGFGLELAGRALREAGVESALLHGGTSSVVAIGRPPDGETWKVAIRLPSDSSGGEKQRFIPLADTSLSVSTSSGRTFSADGETRGHLFSPKSGEPAAAARLGAVVCRSAARADALATGLATGGESLFAKWKLELPDLPAVLITPDGRTLSRGAPGTHDPDSGSRFSKSRK